MARKLAIFDIDGTLYKGSLASDLFHELTEQKVLDEAANKRFRTIVRKYETDQISYIEQVNQAILLFADEFKGVHYGDVLDTAKEIAADALQNRSRYVSELLECCREEGMFLLTISQSPKLIVDLFADELGFDKSYGTVFDIGPQSLFTGEIVDLHLILNKGSILKRVVEREGLTLEDSFGIGDADSDISFLELVEHPICFNPTQVLRREAKRMGWKVVVEQADVVYDIQ